MVHVSGLETNEWRDNCLVVTEWSDGGGVGGDKGA